MSPHTFVLATTSTGPEAACPEPACPDDVDVEELQPATITATAAITAGNVFRWRARVITTSQPRRVYRLNIAEANSTSVVRAL
jgi:hypothetical protein